MTTTLSSVLLDSAYKRLSQIDSTYSIAHVRATHIYLVKSHLFNADVVAAYQCILALEHEKINQNRLILYHLSVLLRLVSSYPSRCSVSDELIKLLLGYFIKHSEHWKKHSDNNVFADIAYAVYMGIQDPCLRSFIAKHVVELQTKLFANIKSVAVSSSSMYVETIANLPIKFVSAYNASTPYETMKFLVMFSRYDAIDTFDKESRLWMVKEQYLGVSDPEVLERFVGWRFFIKRYTFAASRIQYKWRRHRIRKLKQWIACICHTRGLAPSIGYLMYQHTAQNSQNA